MISNVSWNRSSMEERLNTEQNSQENGNEPKTHEGNVIQNDFKDMMPIRIGGFFGLIALLIKIIVLLVSFVCIGRKGIRLLKNRRDDWKAQSELTDKQKALLESWKIQWNSTEDCSCDCFYQLFVKVYCDVVWKKVRNKRKNFWWKGLFIIIMLAGFAAYLVFFFWSIFHSEYFNSFGSKVLENGFLLFLLILLCAAVSKWMDVRKYQETWARQSMHQNMLESEMMLFIYGMEPYNMDKKKETFMKRTLDIWNKNQEKFNDNMKNEKEMMDAFKELKITK